MAGFLSGDVKVPGTGGKVPKWAAAAGLGVVGVLIWRHRTSAGTAAAAAASPGTVTGSATDAFPWDGTYGNPNDPNSMDPGTGVTYGNEGPGGGAGSITGGPGGGGGAPGPPFSTNAQWSQYVLGYFTDNSYGNIPGRTDAIGRYLAGEGVNSQQETWINDAIAIGGRPPVAGSRGFPPSIRVSGTKTGGKTYADNPVKGLRVRVLAGGTPPRDRHPVISAEVSWDASPHAATYRVTVTEGRRTVRQSETSGHKETVHGLTKGAEYEVKVLARPARPSAHEADTRFRA